jgi:hypothetical protein
MIDCSNHFDAILLNFPQILKWAALDMIGLIIYLWKIGK